MENFVSFNWYVAFVSRKETHVHLHSLFLLGFSARFCSSANIYRVWIYAGSLISKVMPNLNFKTQDITGSFNTVAYSIV